ncbi:hypothetical protein MKK53_06525 [Methylobacterium sp. J-076]|nr:hypothetical protein [Methylobacterium sp. J-076]
MDAEQHRVIKALRESGTLRRNDINYLIRHGRSYRGRPLPDGTETFPPNECITASRTLFGKNGWSIIQGWAILPPSIAGELIIPVFHAWVTPDGETAFDGVWPDAENASYFGLTFEYDGQIEYMLTDQPPPKLGHPRVDLLPGKFARSLERSLRLF